MQSSEADLASLGPWAQDDLAATVRETTNGIGADSDLPVGVRFLGAIAKLVKRRAAQEAAQADPLFPAVFLLRPNPGELPTVTHQREPLLNSGVSPVTGRLWFVSEAANSGRFVELAKDLDTDALFEFVTERLNLGEVPALLFDPRPKVQQFRYYARGMRYDDDCQIYDLETTDISVEQIFRAIDKVYHGCLITPLVQSTAGKLWKNGHKFHPVPRTEDVIQNLLRAGLATAFLSCTPRHEQNMKSGRCDILIEESDPKEPGKIICHAIVELKVLRSFDSGGNAVAVRFVSEAVKEGVTQAASYRDERPTRLAMLCCFDMRVTHTNDKVFEGVRRLAKAKQVSLRSWFIFSTSKRYREFIGIDVIVWIRL